MGNICSKKKAVRKDVSDAGVKHEASKETSPVWRLLCCCARSQTEEKENGTILKNATLYFIPFSQREQSTYTYMYEGDPTPPPHPRLQGVDIIFYF